MWQQLKQVFRTPRKKFWDMLMNNHEYSGKTSSAKSSSRSIFMRMSQLSRLFLKYILKAVYYTVVVHNFDLQEKTAIQ